MRKNPCFGCPKSGCGDHANCKEYMDFYADNRKKDKGRLIRNETNGYVKDTSLKIMKRRRLP